MKLNYTPLPKLATLLMALFFSSLLGAAEAPIDDEALAKTIQKAFDSNELYADVLIKVTSVRGFILLSGQVVSAEQRDTATNTIVFASKKIRRIINELQIVPVVDTSTTDADADLKERVENLLIYSNEPLAEKVSVIVHRSVVYLMGALTPAEIDEVSKQASTVSGVASIKTGFEYLSE